MAGGEKRVVVKLVGDSKDWIASGFVDGEEALTLLNKEVAPKIGMSDVIKLPDLVVSGKVVIAGWVESPH